MFRVHASTCGLRLLRRERGPLLFDAAMQTISLSLLLGLVFSFIPAQVQETPEQLLARAVELHQKGDLENAIRTYQAYLAQRPAHSEARSNLGAALAKLGRYQEAITQYQQALAQDVDNLAVRFNLAVAYYKTARFELAAQALTTIYAAQPAHKSALLLLSDCQLRLGNYLKVIELLTPLERVEPDNRAVAYLLGMAFINTQQLEQGKARIDRILSAGDTAEAHLLMGAAHLAINDFKPAVREFQRALELNPKLPTLNSLYGQTLKRMGASDEAAQAFQRELQLNPHNFEANLHLGILLRQAQQLPEASQHFQQALLLRPGEFNARFHLASLDVAYGKLPEAMTALEALVKDAPTFVAAHVTLASVYYRLRRKADGDREQAIVNQLNAEQQAKERGAQDKPKP
jgi:tetratricopeptide (TPR) repeat protein